LYPDKISYKKIPKIPHVERDIAIVVDENITSAEITKCIVDTALDVVKSVKLFDVYRGKPIPKGKKSLAYSITLQADDKTLTDEDIEGIMESIIASLQKTFSAELRSYK
ncbi:MAG: phenylalanine--tRNA ligase subunit beta, partial [Nitrospirae bacterium]